MISNDGVSAQLPLPCSFLQTRRRLQQAIVLLRRVAKRLFSNLATGSPILALLGSRDSSLLLFPRFSPFSTGLILKVDILLSPRSYTDVTLVG